jgi:hypothetical protein
MNAQDLENFMIPWGPSSATGCPRRPFIADSQARSYKAGPLGEREGLPGQGPRTFLLQEKPALCNAIVLDFLANDAVSTVAPIRRAPAQPED